LYSKLQEESEKIFLMGNLKKLADSKPEFRHNVLRRLGQIMLSNLFVTVLLFGLAGTTRWLYAWLYISILWFANLAALFVAPLEILAERGSKKENAEEWDKVVSKLLILSSLSIFLIAGLDYRLKWTPALSEAWPVLGIVIFFLGLALQIWAMYVNHFFSTAVRIQFDRGHKVCTTGPYRYVRHPGYLGMIAYYLVTPIFLGSLWAMIPALATMILFITRTALEDRTLIQKLPGYQEYAVRTRYRLIPGVW
jgi:protein-S-isoprenylcysteine O-methyltransferase Ste14